MVFSKEKFLKEEYDRFNIKPTKVKLGKQEIILPVFYVLNYSEGEAPKQFLEDLHDNANSKHKLSTSNLKAYQQAVKLTAKANRYTDEKLLTRVDGRQRRNLQKFIAGKNFHSDNKIINSIVRYKNRLLYGSLIAAATFGGMKALSLAKYEKYAVKILQREGGYADANKMDQETKYGITNPTLKSFKENFPKDAAGFPEGVKDLSLLQANKIIQLAFYEHYKINEIKNESVADMVLDAVFTHDYNTFRDFVKEGLIAVKQMRGEDIETRPRNWKDVPKFLNNCSNEEQKAFYDAMVQARIDFINQDGYIKKYKGLKKRVQQFAGKYHAEAYSTNKALLQTKMMIAVVKNNKLNKETISWNEAMAMTKNKRGYNG